MKGFTISNKYTSKALSTQLPHEPKGYYRTVHVYMYDTLSKKDPSGRKLSDDVSDEVVVWHATLQLQPLRGCAANVGGSTDSNLSHHFHKRLRIHPAFSILVDVDIRRTQFPPSRVYVARYLRCVS